MEHLRRLLVAGERPTAGHVVRERPRQLDRTLYFGVRLQGERAEEVWVARLHVQADPVGQAIELDVEPEPALCRHERGQLVAQVLCVGDVVVVRLDLFAAQTVLAELDQVAACADQRALR
ncbi:hypothetical protein [Sphaerisporangium aureirubrum]|uniref:Uncharacterized protein n=1 Tax=Sphaerisporangium aureirubrum TaxID=1544736 RepID=A0ABW1NMK7_9ACTN